MKIVRLFVILFAVISAIYCNAQDRDSAKVRLNHYSLNVGVGWTHYINNLESGDENIKQNFVGISLRFFWEPEHRLALGLETGYYKLFKTKNQVTNDISAEVDRAVIPMLLLVRMRIVDNVYLGAGMGLAQIQNRTIMGNDKVVTKTLSLSNFQLSASYIYPLSKRWRIGGEAKVYSFGNLNDWMYSLQGVAAVIL